MTTHIENSIQNKKPPPVDLDLQMRQGKPTVLRLAERKLIQL